MFDLNFVLEVALGVSAGAGLVILVIGVYDFIRHYFSMYKQYKKESKHYREEYYKLKNGG